MGNVKSHSKYVIRKKHQLINNGAIFERDFSTVGGITKFPSTQKPYYHSGNFIVTVNTVQVTPKHYLNANWEKNGDGYTWTLEDVQNITSATPNANKIILKQNYYKLHDFAYFGSCVELIRASISDIIKRFPGELYSPTFIHDGIESGIFVKKANKVDDLQANETDGIKYLVNNPFNLDIHTPINNLSEEQKKDIKYIQANIDKYEVFYNNKKFTINKIKNTVYKKACGIDEHFQRVKIELIRDDGETHDMFIDCFKGINDTVIYLTRDSNLKTAIRPLNIYYEEFMSSLDIFQQLLLQRNSTPLYSTIFEVLEETDYGYNSIYEHFTFPLGYGGYNLGIDTDNYNNYIDKLFLYANHYDECFCDNLNRQMTHESIKNFDYSSAYDENKDEYEFSSNKLQKILNVFGRELDEIKFYIDGIKDCNQITYNENNNLPDYFLTDILDVEGWDVKNILSSDDFLTIKPYNTNATSYFLGYFGDDCTLSTIEATSSDILDNKDVLRIKIQEYLSNREYNVLDTNHKFFKNLKLNSRNILQKKGTIQSIEEILSLFGLKNKNWSEKHCQNSRLINNNEIDYTIQEYIVDINSGYIDTYDSTKGMYKCDWYNYHKDIIYDTDEYRSGEYVPYQGLPIRYKEGKDGYYYIKNEEKVFLTDSQRHEIIYSGEKNEIMHILIPPHRYEVFYMEKNRYLYPYFSKNMIIDGEPYYQMYGGWVKNGEQYNDTSTQIPIINNIIDLLRIPTSQLYNGVVYFVKNVKENIIIIDDVIYDVYINEENATHYIQLKIENKLIFIGRTPFTDVINVDGKEINLNNKRNGEIVELNVTLNDNFYFNIIDGDITIQIKYNYFQQYKNNTNYFYLKNINNKQNFDSDGWKRLKTTDKEYQKVINIKRYYKGNNPHKGNLIYDDGKEYLRYFQQLFKHSLENNLFDSSISDDDIEIIKNIGFNVLTISEDKCSDNDIINMTPSPKILSFIGENEREPDTIINIKNVKITFKKYNDKYVEYIENFILHYLLQVIPNNTILEIAYE